MKFRKLISIFILTIFCLSFTGCNKSSAKDKTVVKNNNSQKEESTIAFLSDTQFYSKYYPYIYNIMTNYLKDNQQNLNLSYIVHTGDIVEDADLEQQWINARKSMDIIKDIPHGVLAGNHDTSSTDSFRNNYHKYFGSKYYENCSWYGENRNNNDDHYDLITIGKTNFIFVYLSDNPSQESIDFANKAFEKHKDRVGVLCVHNYITLDKEISKVGNKLQKEVVAKNSNVYMVLCGHCSIVGYIPDEFKDGQSKRTVYQIIADYQNIRDGGYMMLLKYNDSTGKINAVTYSPYKDEYLQGQNGISTHSFSFKAPWKE